MTHESHGIYTYRKSHKLSETYFSFFSFFRIIKQIFPQILITVNHIVVFFMAICITLNSDSF